VGKDRHAAVAGSASTFSTRRGSGDDVGPREHIFFHRFRGACRVVTRWARPCPSAPGRLSEPALIRRNSSSRVRGGATPHLLVPAAPEVEMTVAAPLAARATAILRDEIANGALANIAAARHVWAADRRDLISPDVTRRLNAGLGGLLDTVLDLLAPASGASATSALPPPGPEQDHAPERGQHAEPVPVLRARRPVPPGGAAVINTGLRNDGPGPVEFSFMWSDLVAAPARRIQASRLRLVSRIRVPPGASIGLTIGLDVPPDAEPGVYHALLQTTERAALRALLTFPIGTDIEREELIDR
jgi:hypothetical protein